PRPELQTPTSTPVPRYDPPAIRRLHIPEERAAHRHVPESSRGRVQQRPACCQHHYLGELPPRHVVARPEVQAGAWLSLPPTCVTGDQVGMVGRLYVLVGGLGGRHVAESGGGRGV